MKKIIFLVPIIVSAFFLGVSGSKFWAKLQTKASVAVPTPSVDEVLATQVFPTAGVELPLKWGDLGQQLVEKGVINLAKFEALYTQRDGLPETEKALLTQANNGNLKITEANANFILNLLWALGLGNQNVILAAGPMVDKQYGGADKFASTGGWTLASGPVMSHYSKHQFITLTSEQQKLVEEVAKNIYRPCCDNSTYFPDCNHGMAMLALLELMAAQGATEQQMYRTALAVNSYWFPSTYLTIAKYEAKQGVSWDRVDSKQVLGAKYSSASGYQQILAQVEPVQNQKGGGCGV